MFAYKFHLNACNLFHEQSVPKFDCNVCHFSLYELFKTSFIFVIHVFLFRELLVVVYPRTL